MEVNPEISPSASENVEIFPTLLLNQRLFYVFEDFTDLPFISSASLSFNTP